MSKFLEWLLNLEPGRLSGGTWTIGFVEHNNYVKLLLLGVLIFMVWLTAHCYRREGQTRPRTKGILAGLRIAVIAILLLMLFQPAVVLRIRETLYSSVLVLIDDSMSMSYQDHYASADQQAVRQQLADKLGVSPLDVETLSRMEILKRLTDRPGSVWYELARDHPVEFMRFSADQSDTSYTNILGTIPCGQAGPPAPAAAPAKPIDTELLDAARADLKALAGKTAALDEETAVWAADEMVALAKDDPELVRFVLHSIDAARAAESGDSYIEELLEALRKPLQWPGRTIRPGDLTGMMNLLGADGFETDPARAMRDALDRFQGRRIGALVMIGDGMPTVAGVAGRLEAAKAYADQRGAPRFSVITGDPTPPKNVAVLALRAPREIRENAQTEFTVTLSHRNLEGQTVDLCLSRRRAGEDWPEDYTKLPVLARRQVVLVAPEAEDVGGKTKGAQEVPLDFEPKDLGEYIYRAWVAKRADEQTRQDNFADAYVKISDEKTRILLISGDAGWEFQYLRNYFLRQPELYRLSVWQQSADKEVNQSASTGMKLSRLPRSLKELIDSGRKEDKDVASAPRVEGRDAAADAAPPGYHVVILYDPEPTEKGFDQEFLNLLYDYVTVHRGGLCYIASNKNSWDVLRDPAAKKLADLLPVTLAQNKVDVAADIQVGKKSWPVKLTSYGLGHPVTRLENGDENNRELWSVLPGVFWTHAVYRVKPGARTLAVNSNPMRKTELKNEDEPLIACHTAGSGRVVYLGFDETWRWRFIEDGFYHRRFWGNLVRYLAPLGARQVVIATGGDRFSAGEPVTIDVEAFDKEFKPLRDETFTVKMIHAVTRKATEHVLKKVEDRPGQYKATVLPRHTGTYEITCDPSVAEPNQVASKRIVVELPQAEAQRTEANDRVLRSIASRPEKNFLSAYEIDRLADLIPRDSKTRYDEQRHTLWDTKLALVLLAILLAVEWFVRKRCNMA
jgi:hypothetical protein